jgi:hypothetical protein
MTEAKSKRRWLQFSLRTLLIMTALSSAWLAFYYVPANRADRALKALQNIGVDVSYDYQRVPGTSNHAYSFLVPKPGPALLRSIFGEGFLQHADSLHLNQKPLKPNNAKLIERLPTLSQLWLDGCGIGDEQMPYFSNLRNLDFLLLRDNQITGNGLASIKNLTKLQSLVLSHNRIDDDALSSLEKLADLESLWLDGTNVSDDGLKKLAHLQKLKFLDIDRTSVTAAGADALHVALPNCKVYPFLSNEEEAAMKADQKAQLEQSMKLTNAFRQKLSGGSGLSKK